MRPAPRHAVPATLATLATLGAMLLLAPAPARCAAVVDSAAVARTPASAIDPGSAVDHDRVPILRPPDWERLYWSRRVHQGLVEPLVHVFDIPDKLLWIARGFGAPTRREAVNVNLLDEVSDSAWFTNRNHRRAVPVAELRRGPYEEFLPAKPWTIKHAKMGGWSPGFQIEDANGKKWLVKLDSRGYPQLSSGADVVARTLLHAAGYNVPNNQPVRFRRGDLTLDPKLKGAAASKRFSEADLDSTLAQGAVFPDSSYAATASLFIPGHVLGAPSMDDLRPGDSNDRYSHVLRRELRGLFVVCAWINDWDTEDHQFLDVFVETHESLGHVDHYLLDAGSSFGASATGPKAPWEGYENIVDLPWIARRVISLGFVEEPWRRGRQETDIPSVGNYESAAYRPEDFRQQVPQPAFREMTDRDGYWGAKIVASFSDAQIAAAVEAAHYEDPRAVEYLVRNLIVRRDKIARHWFGRVAPLDFFEVRDGALRFHDLALDLGLSPERTYDIEFESEGGRAQAGRAVRLDRTELPLAGLESGPARVSLKISIAGSGAKPVHVELSRKGSEWIVTRVRHG
jgi:hypothetical protein